MTKSYSAKAEEIMQKFGMVSESAEGGSPTTGTPEPELLEVSDEQREILMESAASPNNPEIEESPVVEEVEEEKVDEVTGVMSLGSNFAGAKSTSSPSKGLDIKTGYKRPLSFSSVEPPKKNAKVQKEAIESFIDNAFKKLLK